jgi:hypothetical protein
MWRWTDERGVQRLVGTDELRAALTSSVLPASTLVWREGMKEWAPASSMPELASAAFAAGASAPAKAEPVKSNGAKAPEAPFDPRSTAERRATLVGVNAPAAAAPAVAAKPVEVPSPGDRPARPGITQIPPFGGPAPEPARVPAAAKVPASPVAPSPRGQAAPIADLVPPKRKIATSEIDALWATTTHSDEDETIPRRVRPSELAAAAAASAAAAQTLRETRAKARVELLAKTEASRKAEPSPEPKSADGKAAPRPGARKPPSPPLRRSADGEPAAKAPAVPAKQPPHFTRTSPGVGRPPPLPPRPQRTPEPPVALPSKPVVPAAPVRIKPPSAGPQADAISGESRTLSAAALHAETLEGVAPEKLAVEITSTQVSAGAPAPEPSPEDALELLDAAPEPAAEPPLVDLQLPRFPFDETSETLPRVVATPPPAPVEPAVPPDAPAVPPDAPEPAELARHADVPAVLHFSAPEMPASREPAPALPSPLPAEPTPPPPPAAPISVAPPAARSSAPPPRRPGAQPVPVPISSLMGAGGVLIGMVVAAFFVGRASAVPAPRLTARPSLGAVPVLARAALPPPPKPCWMVKQPAMWAPKVSRSIPFEVSPTGEATLAIGYARDAKTAMGIEVDLRSGLVEPRFDEKGGAEIERVTPFAKDAFHVVRDGEGTLRSSAAVSAFAVGLANGALSLATPPKAAPSPLWPLAGDEPLDATGLHPTGGGRHLLVFRRAKAIWAGVVGADLKPGGELAQVVGSGGAVGKPSAGWNGREVAVIFADRPAADARYEIRIGHGPPGAPPAATAALPLPKGGPGGDAFAPDLAGLPDGRWVLMWTEGAAGSRAVRAQTLAPDFTPLGDPIALSPPAGNYGQGAIGVASGYAATVFLSKGERSYELWGSVLQCQ